VKTPIYLDYAATTPTDPAVVSVMSRYLGPDGVFGNPASRFHCFGRDAQEAIEQARIHIADLINADPGEIVWTSGATESDNLAIKGVASAHRGRGAHVVTSAIEHKAVLDPCRHLERNGFAVTRIKPGPDGLITPGLVESALRDDTILVSLMHVNNEIGAVTDIETIGRLASTRGISFHVDAAQSAARLPLDMQRQHVDFVSLSGHKMYGPKGVGALYVRRRARARLEPQIHGGGHERGLRSGTLPTHQIAGMGEAARLITRRRNQDVTQTRNLERRFVDRLQGIEQAAFNGDRTHCVPGLVNLRFACVESESLMMALPDVAFSTGSACMSARVEPSYVLRAMGLDDDSAHGSLRFSFGRFTTAQEIDYAAERIRDAVAELRSLSSAWHGACNTDRRAPDSPEGGVRVA
jgi:cysteine desulfurase